MTCLACMTYEFPCRSRVFTDGRVYKTNCSFANLGINAPAQSRKVKRPTIELCLSRMSFQSHLHTSVNNRRIDFVQIPSVLPVFNLKLTRRHINRHHICFNIKYLSLHLLLWMNVMLNFICVVFAEPSARTLRKVYAKKGSIHFGNCHNFLIQTTMLNSIIIFYLPLLSAIDYA